MSLILEALKRSQHEGQADGVAPGLDTPAYVPDQEGATRWRTYLPWLGLLLALFFIAYLLLDKVGAEAPGDARVQEAAVPPSVTALAPTAPEEAVQQAQEPRIKTEPEAAPGVAVKPVAPIEPLPQAASVEGDLAVAALYQREGGATGTSEPPPPQPVPASKATSQSVPAVRVQPADEAEPLSEKTIDIEAVLAKTESELENARLSEHPAPFISKLSQQVKDAIPSIIYSRHDFSSTRGQSSVVLNGQAVKVGGNVKGGIKLDEILPDSIVLSHRGTQFRLRALNSWVNL
jgi:general secretion pathway protein B